MVSKLKTSSPWVRVLWGGIVLEFSAFPVCLRPGRGGGIYPMHKSGVCREDRYRFPLQKKSRSVHTSTNTTCSNNRNPPHSPSPLPAQILPFPSPLILPRRFIPILAPRIPFPSGADSIFLDAALKRDAFWSCGGRWLFVAGCGLEEGGVIQAQEE